MVVTLIFVSGCVNNGNNSPKQDTFAQCLSEKGVVMYGTETCPNCQNQKKLFGDSFQYVTYVECGKGGEDAKKCEDAGITGVPSWKIGGKMYSGQKPLAQLEALAGCDGSDASGEPEAALDAEVSED